MRHTLLLLALLPACATTATLYTPGAPVEATLNGGDDETMLVTTESGLKRRVRREDVREIDHPGNVLATVFGVGGGVLALESIVLTATSACRSTTTGPGPALCIGLGGVSAALFGVMAVGLWTWITSKNAVLNPPPASDGDLSKVPFLKFPGAEPPREPLLLPPPVAPLPP